jgi:hypothetical protein
VIDRTSDRGHQTGLDFDAIDEDCSIKLREGHFKSVFPGDSVF